MTEFELTKSVLALANFRPPSGVIYDVLLRPQPGNTRVAVVFSAGRSNRFIELPEVPDEPALRALYREAAELLNEVTEDERGEPGPRWAKSLGISMQGIGGDQ